MLSSCAENPPIEVRQAVEPDFTSQHRLIYLLVLRQRPDFRLEFLSMLLDALCDLPLTCQLCMLSCSAAKL